MSDCIDILRSIGATCASLNQVGGVDKRVWVTQLNQIESYTFDSDGYINSLVTKQIGSTNYQYQLAKIVGKKNTHSGTYEGVVGDNVNILKQTAILKIYTDSPSDRDKVIDLFDARELVVFFENANGFIEVYGLDKGLDGSALAGGTGVALQDDTVVTVTLSGDQNKLPYYFLVGGSLATSIDYLDSIGFSPIYLIQSYTAGTSTIDFTNNGGDDWDIVLKKMPDSSQLPIGYSIESYDYIIDFFNISGQSPLFDGQGETSSTKTLNPSANGEGAYSIQVTYNAVKAGFPDKTFTIWNLIKVDDSGNVLDYVKLDGMIVNSVNGLVMDVTANITQSQNYPIIWADSPTYTQIGTGVNPTLTLPPLTDMVFYGVTLGSEFSVVTLQPGIQSSVTIS